MSIYTKFLFGGIVGMTICLHGAAQTPLEEVIRRTAPYLQHVEAEKEWLVSRLQMYWHTHATEVYIDGERFDHPGGERAEVPTVKLDGTRSHGTTYHRPPLEQVVPYDDDAQGNVHFLHPTTGKPESVHPSLTGRGISSINRQILGIALDAAIVYQSTNDQRYGRMAFDVFDTYLKGILYRNVPRDIHGAGCQTIVGMTSFEVIHEDPIKEITRMYPLLEPFVASQRTLYDAALKKWADNIIANGVPHNNWNIFQARLVAKIAQILQPDSCYADRRGKMWYIDQIVNHSTERQWSIQRMAEYGYDQQNGIWYESPGYSEGVMHDMAEFANEMERDFGIDLFQRIPVLERTIEAATQYLMPNRMIAGFGDTHPHCLSTRALQSVMDYARRRNDSIGVARWQQLMNAILPTADAKALKPYVSPSFYAPNVSWLIQRSGMDAKHDLCISLNASLGNHQHANGISMELYGKGYVLGPDGGIGRTLYSGQDYKEYYSQFPAHNTVCVNGISSYPVMMSEHAFKLEARYPNTNETGHFVPATFSQLSFTEPRTGARQLRTSGIVKHSATGGYYIDIFRSRTEDVEQFHDYFYHNLGQVMKLEQADGKPLESRPSEQLTSDTTVLKAYTYLHEVKASPTAADVHASFHINQGPSMHLWLQGARGQTLFQALSPVNMEYERLGDFMPYNVIEQPVLTLVARRDGEAWNHPFVAVYEPATDDEPAEIASVSYFTPAKGAVGIKVCLRNGDVDYIFSAAEPCQMSHQGMTVEGVYAVIHNGKILVEQ